MVGCGNDMRHRRNPVVKVLLLPILWTQRLTPREPDDGMLEVALAAFTATRRAAARP